MSGLLLAPLRRWMGLPERRCESWRETQWIAMPDGVRLATDHFWPVGRRSAATLVIRSPVASRGLRFFGRLLAETGYHVVVQDVRGRYRSEGRFTPFVHEGRDGRSTLEWISSQSWCNDRIALLGASYLGYGAWAALGEAPEHVTALAVAIGARDLHAYYYPGGAFRLSPGFEGGLTIGERETVPRRQVDLERALDFRPLLEADRVALRRVDWLRDWLSHPRRDGYWDALIPALPETPPPTLLIAGWYDFFLSPQLGDYADLAARSEESGGAPPRLVVGPWSHGLSARRAWRSRDTAMLRVCLGELFAFLDRELADDAATRRPGSPVRVYMPGVGWRDESSWPPPRVSERVEHLRSGGGANGIAGDGRLHASAAEEDEPADSITHDPAHPVPSLGGALSGRAAGAVDQRPVEERLDVLCYTSDPLDRGLEIAGPVRAVLFVSASTPDADFVAKLVDVSLDGLALNVCEGVARARWRGRAAAEKEPVFLEPGECVELEIELGPTAWRFGRGHRIRLEIAGSSFPRFAPNPGAREEPALAGPDTGGPARLAVHHDAAHASRLVLPRLAR